MPISGRRRSRYTVQGPYEKRGKYHIVFYDTQGKRSPQRKWVSLGTDDESTAHAEWTELRDSFWLGEYDPWEEAKPESGVTLKEALERYMQDYRKGVRESSAEHTRRMLGLFVRWKGEDHPIQAVSSSDIRAWLEEPRSASGGAPSSSTLRTYLFRVRAWMRWADEEGLRDGDPTEAVAVPDAAGDTFSVLSPEELDRLLADIAQKTHRQWLMDLVQIMASSGLRIGEACALRWDDVGRLASGTDMATLHVRPYRAGDVETGEGWKPKTRGSRRQVQVWPRGTSALRSIAQRDTVRDGRLVLRYEGGDPVQATYAQDCHREHAEGAGLIRRDDQGEYIRRVRPHDLRHTFISWMVNEYEHKIGIRTVADQVGHEDVTETDAYRRSNPQSARDAFLRAAGRDPEGGRRPQYEAVRDWLNADAVQVGDVAEKAAKTPDS